jgi:hypothetical protein
LKYVELNFLSEEGIILFVDNFPFSELTFDLWSKIIRRLKEESDDRFHCRRISGKRKRQTISIGSTILSTKPTAVDEFKGKQLRLLYR